MRKKAFFFTLFCCFLLCALAIDFFGEQLKVSFIKTVNARPNTIYVPDNSTSIQEAVNKANPNDTIVVRAGIYQENNITITKTVRLISEVPLGAIIDGRGELLPIVNVAASYVEVAGFVIRNGSDFPIMQGALQVVNKSVGVVIRGNKLTKSYYGLFLLKSNSCRILDNTIVDNYARGIQVSESSYNTFIGNTIENNVFGLTIMQTSLSNVFFHNNFVLNSGQEENFAASTVWDNGAEGNYWSSFTGPDTNGDGIIDTPYGLDIGADAFPLAEPWSYVRFFNVLGQTVSTYSNTTVASFYLNQSWKEIGFNVTGPANKTGFVNVSIPKSLLWVGAGENWTVCIDWEVLDPSSYVVSENATYTFVYVPYGLTTHRIQIFGTHVVPEFSPMIASLLFMITTLLMVVLVRRSRRTEKCALGNA